MIYGLVSFSYVLNPSSFGELNNPSSVETISKNKEYKNMKKKYKNLLAHFINNSNCLRLYLFYLKNIFSNKSMSWIEKYQLIKIYYKFHIVHLLYNNKEDIHSNNKLNIITQKELFVEYRNFFSKLIDTHPPKEQNNETAFELLKSVLILLIYEHKITIPLIILNESKEVNISKDKRNKEINKSKYKKNENQRNTIKSEDKSILEEITFFSSLSLEIMKNQLKNNSCLNNSLSYTNPKVQLEKIEEIETSNDKLMLDTFSEDKNHRSYHSELTENITNINNRE